MNIWIIGAGEIGLQYARILSALSLDYTLFTKTRAKHERLSIDHRNIEVLSNIYKVKAFKEPTHVIVAVDILSSFKVTSLIMELCDALVLSEKPITLYRDELTALTALDAGSNRLMVALNRRFFEPIKICKNHLTSMHVDHVLCEASERGYVVEKLPYDAKLIQNWALCNSIHFWDTMIYLFGTIKPITIHREKPSYHRHTHYYGTLITKNKAKIVFASLWDNPGDWKIDIRGSRKRLNLCPLEKLTITEIDSQKTKSKNYSVDPVFKPGFFEMTKKFILSGTGVSINEYKNSFDLVSKIYYD